VKISGPLKCPECGEEIIGSVDLVPGCALMNVEPDGTFEWAGETEMFWDGQYNHCEDPTKLLVQCRNGHEWLVGFEGGSVCHMPPAPYPSAE
jgi:hypothetical protein